MKDTNKILSIVAILISVVLLVFVFTGNRKLKEAISIINDANTKIGNVKDSLRNASESIGNIMKKLEFTENELKILKAERVLMELEEQKKRANNWVELQDFKAEIKEIEIKKDSLKKEAAKFEL